MARRIARRWKTAVAAAIVAAVVGVVAAAWLSAPSPVSLAARVDLRLRDARGRPVALPYVSPLFRAAVVATEDERFYRHRGVDVLGVLRAVPYDLTHLSLAQGASTITEQVAKLVYLGGSDRTPWHKLQDAALAVKLESRYDKEQILDAYVNSVYFGDGATGVDAASEHYFGVPPARLDLTQASLLAGLIQSPSTYDPVIHPRAARLRQLDVLRSLVRDGDVTEEAAADAAAAPLVLRGGVRVPGVTGVDLGPGPAFVWRELAAGTIACAAALAAYVVLRRAGRRSPARRLAIAAGLALVMLVGIVAIARSFRTL